jgi:hypothetical protein
MTNGLRLVQVGGEAGGRDAELDAAIDPAADRDFEYFGISASERRRRIRQPSGVPSRWSTYTACPAAPPVRSTTSRFDQYTGRARRPMGAVGERSGGGRFDGAILRRRPQVSSQGRIRSPRTKEHADWPIRWALTCTGPGCGRPLCHLRRAWQPQRAHFVLLWLAQRWLGARSLGCVARPRSTTSAAGSNAVLSGPNSTSPGRSIATSCGVVPCRGKPDSGPPLPLIVPAGASPSWHSRPPSRGRHPSRPFHSARRRRRRSTGRSLRLPGC